MKKSLIPVAALVLTAALGATNAHVAAAVATTSTAATKPVDYYALTTEEFFKRPELAQRIAKDSFNLPLLEAAVFHQTNRERLNNKLPLFKYGTAMNLMSRRHSSEMSALQFFDHVSPTPANATLTDRLKNVGLVNVTAGENIAVLPAMEMGSGHYVTHPGQPDNVWFDEASGKRIDYYTYQELAQEVLTQWMNSPHHRENIVNKQYLYLGVGICRGPYEDKHQDSFYLTQNFCDRVIAASEAKAKPLLTPKP